MAAELIDDFLSRLAGQKPKRIILLGPNHEEKGEFKVLTSNNGILKTDKKLTEKLTSLNLVHLNNQIVGQEHSINQITPFIQKHLPQASFLPLVISNKMKEKEIEALASSLSSEVDKETVILASIDFSHYLKKEATYQNDLKSLEIIRNFDYQKISSLGNDFLDAPCTLNILLKTMQKTNHANLEVLAHTNSAELLNNDFTQTTSYFSIAFY